MKLVILDGHALNPGDLSYDVFKEFGTLEYHERTPANLTAERMRDADIVFLNKVELLKKCIYHIYEQDVGYFDVLVVDNGSEDGSIDFIKEAEKKYENFHSILLSENLGFAIAVNKGIQYSIDNKYIFFI